METLKDLREPDLEGMKLLERRNATRDALNKKLALNTKISITREEAQAVIEKRLKMYRELAK